MVFRHEHGLGMISRWLQSGCAPDRSQELVIMLARGKRRIAGQCERSQQYVGFGCDSVDRWSGTEPRDKKAKA